MTPIEQKKAAKAFVGRWKAAEGNEQREANKFWIELFNEVLGIANPTHMLDFERKVKGRRIDVFHEDAGVLIESKSRGINLDVPEQRGKDNQGRPRMITPYEQAKWYADNITPRSASPVGSSPATSMKSASMTWMWSIQSVILRPSPWMNCLSRRIA